MTANATLTRAQRARMNMADSRGLMPAPTHRQWGMYEVMERHGLIRGDRSKPGFVSFTLTEAGRSALGGEPA